SRKALVRLRFAAPALRSGLWRVRHESARRDNVVPPGATFLSTAVFSTAVSAGALQPTKDVLNVDLQERVGAVVHVLARFGTMVSFEVPEKSLEVPASPLLPRPEACERFAGGSEL